MFIDDNTEKALGLDKVWKSLPISGQLGREYLENLEYKKEKKRLNLEYSELSKMINVLKKEEAKILCTKQLLKNLKTLKNTFTKLRNDEVLDEIDVFELKYFLYHYNKIAELWHFKMIKNLWKILDPKNLQTYDFYIYDEYSKKISRIRKRILNLKKLREKIVKKICKEIGIEASEKIVVDKEEKKLIRKLLANKNFKKDKETFSSIVFSVKNEEIDEVDREIEMLILEKNKEKEVVLKNLSEKIKKHFKEIMAAYEKLKKLDFMIAKATFCLENQLKKPKITNKERLVIKKGTHIFLKNELSKLGLNYTPIDIEINKNICVIYGSNMSGKTQALRTIGFIVGLAQAGFFVPAEIFEFKPFDFILFSIGENLDEIGYSTFAQEILRINSVFKRKKEFGLALIDEIARGTNHFEAQALSLALIDEFKNLNSFVLMTTHLPGLLNLKNVEYYKTGGLIKEKIEKLKKLRLENKMENLKLINNLMNYRLEKEGDFTFDAINVALLLGVDKKIIEKAKNYMKNENR